MKDFIPKIKKSDPSEKTRLLSARAYLMEGSYDKAIMECRAALHINSQCISARLLLAKIYSTYGKYDETIEECRAALIINNRLINAYLRLSYVYAEQEDTLRRLQNAKRLYK